MPKSSDLNNVKRIAIIRTDRIGEVLLSTPVIEALHKRFPSASISFVTSPYSADIVCDRPDITSVITFDTYSKRVPIWRAFTLMKKLKAHSFDMAIILNSHKVLNLACFLARIPIRVGYNRKWPFLLTHKAEDRRGKAKQHEVEYNLELLRILDIYETKLAPFMPVLSKSSYYVDGILNQTGVLGKKKIVAIHPGSSNPKKRWAKEKFKQLTQSLINTGLVDVVLIGDRSEKSLCQEIESGLGKSVHNLAGIFTIRKLTAFLKKADVLITNDNGPMHIAASVGTKVVALFNKDVIGSNPTRWAPYGEGHKVFYEKFSELSADEVANQVKNYLGI